MDIHRATENHNPISPNEFSPPSRHRSPRAVNGGGEAHALAVSDVQTARDVLLARCEIAEAYYRGGDLLGLEMLASSSLRLYGRVVAGDIDAPDLFDGLQECAAHLGIADRAQDDVQAALAYGPLAYAEIARVA